MIKIRYLTLRSSLGERKLRPDEMRDQGGRVKRFLSQRGVTATVKVSPGTITLTNLSKPTGKLKNPLTRNQRQRLGAQLQDYYATWMPSLVVSITVK